jgi:hypothetical protein
MPKKKRVESDSDNCCFESSQKAEEKAGLTPMLKGLPSVQNN